MNEFLRIERLARAFGAPAPPDLGIGDDAAVLHGATAVVATVDTAVEGVHFRRDLLSLEDASARAVVSAASDLAAMGAQIAGPGCGLLLAWTLPSALTDDDFDRLVQGAAEAAKELGAVIVGGNLAAAPTLTLTTTALGRCEGEPLRRSGARVGDVVAVTGAPGMAALGLRALFAGRGEEFPAAVRAWKRPVARFAEGLSVRAKAHAAVDLSDGLAQDAGHLARASGVRVVLDPSRFARRDELTAWARVRSNALFLS